MEILFDLHMFDGAEGGAEGAEGTSTAGASDAGMQTADPEAEFEGLVKGQYKAQFDKRVQDIVQKRVKNLSERADRYDKVAPMLEVIAGKYGVDVNDLDGLSNAIDEDITWYEEEAYRTGMTPEQVRDFSKLKRENDALRRQSEEQERQNQVEQKAQRWHQEGLELQKTYPHFNLAMEFGDGNNQFARLLQAGIPVKTAFEVCHKDEIDSAKVSLVAKETEKRISQSVQSGRNRPSESGSRSTSPMTSNVDISKMTNEQIDEYIRRARKGERITFK